MTTYMHTHPAVEDAPASAVEDVPVLEVGPIVEVTVECVINGRAAVITLSQIVGDPELRTIAATTLLREAAHLVETAVTGR